MELIDAINELKYIQSVEITSSYPQQVDELDLSIKELEKFAKLKKSGNITEDDYMHAAIAVCLAYIPTEPIDFKKTVCDNCNCKEKTCIKHGESELAEKLIL
jgi:hypothetical protein